MQKRATAYVRWGENEAPDMRPTIRLSTVIGTIFFLVAVAIMAQSAAAGPLEDACSLLTVAQVSGAVSASVGDGSYVTPTFKKTCTWTAPGTIVTLMLENLDAYQAGKHTNLATSVSGVGDDAYYLGAGSTVGLIVKKGNIAFKVAVYAKIPLERKQAMEKALAQQVISKL